MAHIFLLLTAMTLSGRIPSSIDGSCRVVWIDAAGGDPVTCRIDDREWRCDAVPDAARGIVVAIGTDRVAVAAAAGVENVDPTPGLWGRVVRVDTAGAAPQNSALRAWKPERSTLRPQLRRFRPVADESVRVLKLSATSFWVSATGDIDTDAFLSLDGPDIGSVRISTRQLSNDAPESPFVATAPLPATMTGRVQNARGEDVSDAAIDLFQPLQIDRDPRDRLTPDVAVVARGSTVSRADGVFVFDHVSEPPFLVVASAADGRASEWVTSLGPPVIIALTPPLLARGRVVRHGMPIIGARIHFVPTVDAWASSTDPAAHLVEEVVAADEGTFVLALPEQPTGEIQVVSPEGATARVPIVVSATSHSRELSLGDISIPDPRRVVVRLLEPPQSARCDVIATGPLGRLGLQMVRSSSTVNIYSIDLPETGRWVLSAECGGTSRNLAPMIVTIAAAGTDPGVQTIDVRFAR